MATLEQVFCLFFPLVSLSLSALRHKLIIYFSYISVVSLHAATAPIQRHLAVAILHPPHPLVAFSFWRMPNGVIVRTFISAPHIELSSHLANGAGDLNMGKLANSSSSPFIPSPTPSPSPSSTSSPTPDSLSSPSDLPLSLSISPVLPSSMSAANISEANFSPLLLVLQLEYREFPWPLLGLLWIRVPL